MDELTVKEALEQGFEHYGIAERDFQHLQNIEDADEDEFKAHTLLLFEKEPSFFPSIDAESIADLVANHMEAQVSDNTQDDDTSDVYKEVMKLDFTAAAEMVNKALAHRKYYTLSKIKLIPNPKEESNV